MEEQVIVIKEDMDREWVELILSALEAGMSIAEIKEYFQAYKNIHA